MLVQAHVRNAEDYDSPEGEVFNSGWEDQGFLVHFTHAVAKGFLSAAWQSDYGRDFERPRNNSQTVRFFYPFENSHRFTTSYEVPDVAGFRPDGIHGIPGRATSSEQTRTVLRPRRPGAASNARTCRRTTSMSREARERLLGRTRVEFGVDVNGRYGLEAFDIIQAYSLAGAITRDTTNVSVDDARRVDTGAVSPGRIGRRRICAGLRQAFAATA